MLSLNRIVVLHTVNLTDSSDFELGCCKRLRQVISQARGLPKSAEKEPKQNPAVYRNGELYEE